MDHERIDSGRASLLKDPDRTVAVFGDRGDRHRHPAVIAEDLDRAPIQEDVKPDPAVPETERGSHLAAEQLLPRHVVDQGDSAQVQSHSLGAFR